MHSSEFTKSAHFWSNLRKTARQFENKSIFRLKFNFCRNKIYIWKHGSVPSMEMQTPLPWEVALFTSKMPTGLKKRKINFPIIIFRVMVDRIYNCQVCHLYFQVCHKKKGHSKSDQIYSTDAQWSGKDYLFHGFFFVRLLVFEIRSILMYMTLYIKIDHIESGPYLKH